MFLFFFVLQLAEVHYGDVISTFQYKLGLKEIKYNWCSQIQYIKHWIHIDIMIARRGRRML